MAAQVIRVALVFVLAASAGLATGDNAPTRRSAGTDRVSAAGVSGETRSRPATTGCDRCPLAFEPNLGQSDPRVKFTSHGAGYTLFLTDTETVFAMRPASAPQDAGRSQEHRHAAPGATMRLTLAGAAPPARLRALEPLPGISNYVIGSDSSKWRSNVPHYARVRGEGVYPGIDVEYYGNERQLEFDFIVAPGADPGVIALNVDGASGIELDGGGDVVMRLGEDEVRLKKPFAYQEIGGARREIESDYTIADNGEVRMRLASYDRTRPLVIDPLVYGTLLGGTGDDFALAAAVDGAGSAYIAGITSSTNFPTTPGVADTTFGGGTGDFFDIPSDGFVTKLNALGSAVVYSTYLGGSNDDAAIGVKVDGGGNAYVTGFTGANPAGAGDFPTTPGAFQTTYGGGFGDGFVTKLNSSGQLVYSTYLGGGCTDQARSIAIDTSGNAYIAGQSDTGEPADCTQNFPTTAGAFQTTSAAAASTVTVVKLNAAGSGLVYATFLGGMIGSRLAELIEPGGIAVDSDGSAYVVGKAYASDFPTTPGAFQTTRSGTGIECGGPCADAFVTKFNPAGTGLGFSTYLGGSDREQDLKIAINVFGDACVAGRTESSDFPTTAGAYQRTPGGGDDVFLTCVSASGTSLNYSTLFGGTDGEEVFSIALDTNGNAYIAGSTSSSNLPTTADAEQTSFNGGTGETTVCDDPCDAFIAKFNSIGTTLLYSSYLGATGDEVLGALLVKPTTVLAAGATTSANFPLTSGTYQTTRSGPSDTVVVKLTPPRNFTDEPLVPGVTVIKAIHVNELRQSLHLQRKRFGLPLFSFTGTLTAGMTVITAQHILDLRTALSQLNTAATDAPPTFTDPDLTAGTAIKAVHLTEIRNAMLTFQANH